MREAPQRLLIAACVAAVACGSLERDEDGLPSAPPVASATPSPSQDVRAWASRVRSIEPAAAKVADDTSAAEAATRQAVMDDAAEDSDELVLVGRFVYRVSFVVPPSFRDHRAVLEAPAGELHLDVSHARLRARFHGPGFPVAEGAEVRLRADLPGVYLFDEHGGRSLGAGQLAAWFEGLAGDRDTRTRVGIWREMGKRAAGPLPTDLLCAFLAEWANQDREGLAYRCAGGSLPPMFRIGPWTGELTAVLPLQLPRRALRADELGPPQLAPNAPREPLLEASAIARLPPSRAERDVSPGALVVHNFTPSRALLFAQGVAVAWVEAGQSAAIEGFAPGFYRMGAVRPLGVLRMPPKLVRAPGELSIGRP